MADSMSFEFVRGSKVDYSQELIKSSFEVILCPKASTITSYTAARVLLLKHKS